MKNFWLDAGIAGFAGFGAGLGLVLGAFVARTLRRYMRDEDMKGTNGNGGRK